MELEFNSEYISDKDKEGLGLRGIAITPPGLGNDNYWVFRVNLSKDQSIIAFPKFFTLGVGFAKEGSDWNTNLPYSSGAEKIYNHIKINKGDSNIKKKDCVAAIKILQEACEKFMQKKNKC